ncbi:hypothetical protein ABZ953_07185 [Streptomyces sp. NPDC046465]|uniref:hypothetical protein n=1 Tax=Streptomyces sp. NPDC046465 TaxID=3155810 RepID=UPI0033FFE549
MDIDDLHRLGAYLETRDLRVAARGPGLLLTVTNPLSSHLTEEVRLAGGRYLTSFDYEIGEQGDEQACAERIARILAVGDQHQTRRPT